MTAAAMPAWARKAHGEDVKVTYPTTPPVCWCGGAVGTRDLGDQWGLGCLESIQHDWTNLATQFSLVVQLVKTGQHMGDHAADVITFAQVDPSETVSEVARRLLHSPYMKDEFSRERPESEWYLRIQFAEPAPRRPTKPPVITFDWEELPTAAELVDRHERMAKFGKVSDG